MTRIVSILSVFILLLLCLSGCKLFHMHKYDEWIVVSDSTCAEAGQQIRYCECGESQVEMIPTLPHTEVIDDSVAPTCSVTGLTGGTHCSVCSGIIIAQEIVKTIPHTYSNDMDSTCEVCGFTRHIECSHNEVIIVGATNPTCTETGAGAGKMCLICQKFLDPQSISPALGHNVGDWVVTRAPSKEVDGYKIKTCSRCGEIIAQEVIPYIGETDIAYQVNSDGKTCVVVGIGGYQGSELYIPEYIRGYEVVGIGDYAFAECSQLTKLVIPDTITSIGERAFYACTGLTEFTIPKTVSKIGKQIFYKAENLSTVYYNTSYSDVSYGTNNNPILSLPHITTVVFGNKKVSNVLCGATKVEKVVLPTDVETIPNDAFKGCNSLTDIVLPNSVVSIGDSAFDNCWSLEKINIPAGVTNIGSSAFYNCVKLQNVVLPSGLDQISYGAFRDCKLFTEMVIPDKVTSIGGYAFAGCELLEKINIPSDVTYIGNDAFSGCASIKNIELPIGLGKINNSTFYKCSSLTSIVIPDGVSEIAYSAFYYCTSLTSIVIPETVTTIGNNAFNGCYSLLSIDIPSAVTSIGSSAFSGCSQIKEVVVPKGVTKISSGTFSSCESLVDVTLPEGLLVIDGSAFSGCKSMKKIVIPGKVTTIGNSVFSHCTSLESIVIPTSVESIGSDILYYYYGEKMVISDIYYLGSEEQWSNIVIDPDNDVLLGLRINYNCTIQ